MLQHACQIFGAPGPGHCQIFGTFSAVESVCIEGSHTAYPDRNPPGRSPEMAHWRQLRSPAGCRAAQKSTPSPVAPPEPRTPRAKLSDLAVVRLRGAPHVAPDATLVGVERAAQVEDLAPGSIATNRYYGVLYSVSYRGPGPVPRTGTVQTKLQGLFTRWKVAVGPAEKSEARY